MPCVNQSPRTRIKSPAKSVSWHPVASEVVLPSRKAATAKGFGIANRCFGPTGMAEVLRVVEIVPISPNVVALIAQWLVGVETDVPVAADASASQLDVLTARWLVYGVSTRYFPMVLHLYRDGSHNLEHLCRQLHR